MATLRIRSLSAWFLLGCIGLAVSPVRAQTAPETPAPQSAGDRAIEAQLRAVFKEVAGFAPIQVEVRSGVVKLTGQVKTTDLRGSAEEIARKMPGVIYVANGIGIDAPAVKPPSDTDIASDRDQRAAERLRGIFARFDGLAPIQVEVVAGVARLRGEVVAAGDKIKAGELAKSVDGIVFVSNQIEETVNVFDRVVPSVGKMVGWVQGFVVALPLFLVALLVTFLFWGLGNLISRNERLFARLSDKKLVQDVLQQIVRTLMLLLGVYLALEIMDATALVGAVLGAAGVVGLALGFAFRDIVENYLASVILSFRQPFRSKDFVEIDGKRGTVLRMTTRETVLLTAEGNHLILPNATVFKSCIINFTRSPQRRFDVAIGVGTDVDLTQARELGLSVLREMAGVLDDPPPFALVESLGDSSVKVRFYAWVNQREADFSKVNSAAVRLIKGIMDENGVDMPTPMYQVSLRQPGKAGDPPHPARNRPSAHEAAASADVTLDRQIEKQVEEELRRSGEEDLLEEEPPKPEQPATDGAPASAP